VYSLVSPVIEGGEMFEQSGLRPEEITRVWVGGLGNEPGLSIRAL